MRATKAILLAISAVTSGVFVWFVSSPPPTPTPISTRADIARASTTGADIAFYERRAAEDAWSAADRAALARLYLQSGRETGEYRDYQRAEAAARAALQLRRERNEGAKLMLASSLLAQHRFVEARAVAERIVADAPDQVGSRALFAEILLELGEYQAANREFGVLEAFTENLAVSPRLARWHELNGRNERAGAILRQSAALAEARSDLPPEQVAWFQLRVADHALRNGKLRAAERAIERGLAANPRDYRLHSARARVYAARENWASALREVEMVGARADLATLGLGGDAARALGRTALAESFYQRVEEQARANPEPFARQWTQFCLEHGRRPQETLRTLEAEIRIRRDILGHELLAWAYEQAGRNVDARVQIQAALRLGTRDALLQYLAGVILNEPARRAEARRINPSFASGWLDLAMRHPSRQAGTGLSRARTSD
jgi:tetratricopeptide (TPR) repeat protein